jgi:glycosyltransferase involved in cell wall biosynthesis
MKVSGFSFVRNAVKYDYPFIESIQSLLPLCDEFVVAVGASEDDTLDKILALPSPKIKVIETVWDDSLRTGGAVLAQQTNLALDQVSGDWAFYLQADEVVHEHDLPTIERAMREFLDDSRVEGLLFNYNHFYGSYGYVGVSRQWYRREIRVVRPRTGVRSWGDAQGFRIDGRKMRVKLVDASIYHYGWVKPPQIQQTKQESFNKLWHSDEWVERNIPKTGRYSYARGGTLEPFTGMHPRVMAERVRKEDWKFEYDPSRVERPLKERVLDWVEERTGWRVGEYRNYELL